MSNQQIDSVETIFPESALKAGEDVLREMEPDYFEYGQNCGWHYRLVSNIASAVLQASGIDAGVHYDIEPRRARLR